MRREEEEYRLAGVIFCPSDFVVRTFVNQRFPRDKLVRFICGVDEKRFSSDMKRQVPNRDGLNYDTCRGVRSARFSTLRLKRGYGPKHGGERCFMIVGEFILSYGKKLTSILAHPSLKFLDHWNNVPALMRECGFLVLPSIEEGFVLVCTEAMTSGYVPLVSEVYIRSLLAYGKRDGASGEGRQGFNGAHQRHQQKLEAFVSVARCRIEGYSVLFLGRRGQITGVSLSEDFFLRGFVLRTEKKHSGIPKPKLT
ncbi:MAG: hypothetical protein QXS68_06870 [Candidatus Methanomethylicaceae archaeon]